jgi:hypothetical protein
MINSSVFSRFFRSDFRRKTRFSNFLDIVMHKFHKFFHSLEALFICRNWRFGVETQKSITNLVVLDGNADREIYRKS